MGTALIFLLGAAGQFIAALRHPWTYAAAFGCTALSVLLMAAMTGDRAADCLPDWAPRPWANPMLYVGASLTMAAASVLVAIFLGFGRNSATRANPRS